MKQTHLLVTMKHCGPFLMLGFTLLSSSGAFNLLVPDGKELIYEYSALVRAGSNHPIPHGSEFYLNAILHLQADSDAVLAKLSDLTFKLYNGQLFHGHEDEAEEIPTTEKFKDLLRVFKIYYNSYGQAKGISIGKEEMAYVVDIKKGIASLLQLDLQNIQLNEVKRKAFRTNEQMIYGNIMMGYNVSPQNDKIAVEKRYETETTQSMYKNVMYNFECDYCDVEPEKLIFRDGKIRYTIANNNNQHIVEQIEANGGVYLYPFRANSATQHVMVTQTLQMITVLPIEKRLEILAEQREENLFASQIDPELMIPGVTTAHQKMDLEDKVSFALGGLKELRRNLKQNWIDLQQPGELVNRLVRFLAAFDYIELENLHNSLQAQELLDIFHQLLPLVGTHDSVMFVKKCINEKMVENDVARDMLHKLPFHVRAPTEQLLEDIEDLLNWGDGISWNVRRDAIFCFATLIHKTFKFQLNSYQQDDVIKEVPHIIIKESSDGIVNVEPSIRSFFNDHQIYHKYIQILGKKFKSAEDYEVQTVYISALFNTRVYSSSEYLFPIIMGETNHDYKIQLLATIAFSPLIYRDFPKLFELFWPMVTDQTQHTEVRFIAYYLIMESHPPRSLLLEIHEFLQDGPNEELYHFHYRFLETLSRSTESCYEEFKETAAQVLRLSRKPRRQSLSGFYQADYKDPKYGFGGGFRYFWFDFESSLIFSFNFNSHMLNVNGYSSVVLIRVHGLEQRIPKSFQFDLQNYEDLWKLLTNLSSMKNIQVDVIVAQFNQIIWTSHYNNSNLQDLMLVMDLFDASKCETLKNSVEINYDLHAQIFLPTDLGIPAVVEVSTPTIYQKHLSSTQETLNKVVNIHLDSRYQFSKFGLYGISFYNPLADVWQGISRYHANNFALPLYADVTVNIKKQSVKISSKRHKEEEKNVIGFASHVTTNTFVMGGLHNEVLMKSCPRCEKLVTVAKGSKVENNYTINQEIHNIGYRYQIHVYNSEKQIKAKTPHQLLATFTNNIHKSYWTSTGFLLTFVDYWYTYSKLLPALTTGGFVIKIESSQDLPITSIDITFQIKKEITDHQTTKPGVKLNVLASYSLMDNDKIRRTWGLSATTIKNTGQTLRTTEVEITNKIPFQRYFKICIDDVRKWTNRNVNGWTTIARIKSADGKCTKDDIIANVTMMGSNLELEEDGVCYPSRNGLQFNYFEQCGAIYNSIRTYSYSTDTTTVPAQFKKTTSAWYNMVKGWYAPYYTIVDQDEIGDKTMLKIEVENSAEGNLNDLKVFWPRYNLQLSDMPDDSWVYMFLNAVGLVNTVL